MIDELPCSTDSYQNLVSGISGVYSAARDSAARSVNSILVQAYWEIGRYIVEFEQGGDLKSEYGSKLIERLSRDLTAKFGKGFSRSNLRYIRKFYITHQKRVTLSRELSWSHYYQILKADDELEISFYERECEIEGWSVRELRRQMDSMLFHRIALSKDKGGIFHFMLCILRVFYIGGICAAVRRIFPVEVFHGGNAVLHGMSPQVSGSVMFCSELVL